MPIYKEDNQNQQLMADFDKVNKEHHRKMEEARNILKQDIPPFLSLALASRIIGREEAKKLQEIISKANPK